jgi:hypothetical protein
MSNTKAVRRPDDSPFDLNLDTVRAEAELTPYVVQWFGRRWSFAHLQGLDTWHFADLGDVGDMESICDTLQTALGDEQWEEFRTAGPLPGYKMKALFQGYQRHCGFRPGESGASTSS